MITKEEFFKFIENYNQFCEGIKRLEKVFTGGQNFSIGFFECDWVDSVSRMLDTFVYSHFTDKGVDWIYYFLFETIEDKKVTVTKEKDMFNEEEKTEYHLNTLDALWNFLQTDVNLYFKHE